MVAAFVVEVQNLGRRDGVAELVQQTERLKLGSLVSKVVDAHILFAVTDFVVLPGAAHGGVVDVVELVQETADFDGAYLVFLRIDVVKCNNFFVRLDVP